LSSIGEDVDREGLEKTPARVAELWSYLTSGYAEDPQLVLRSALFKSEARDPIFVHDITYYSVCEHHLLPFFGSCQIAYIPDQVIVGLSKIVRLVDIFSRRLQVQERMTGQIADTLQEILKPRGVLVLCEGSHLCMMMRGVERAQTSVTTLASRGAVESDEGLRNELRSVLLHRTPVTKALR
ncbi:MAG: GTP cyclohydrolase I FolE, partial [Bdellovibrionales bacterium]|nr:GTP cyclohydrolase I FolE [Bdellovibrionales bacterium]